MYNTGRRNFHLTWNIMACRYRDGGGEHRVYKDRKWKTDGLDGGLAGDHFRMVDL